MEKSPKSPEVITPQEASATANVLRVNPGRLLSAEQFHRLTDVPAILVWLANI